MKCPKCEKEIKDGSKFCKHCGSKIEELQNKVNNKEEQNELKETEKIEKKSDKKIEKNNEKEKTNNLENDNKLKEFDFEKIIKELKIKLLGVWNNKLNLFEKSLFCFEVVVILALIVSLIAGKTSCAIVSSIQMVGIIVTGLIEKNIIKTDKNWIKYVIPILCILMTVFYINFFKANSSVSSDTKNIIWSELILGEKIPELKNFKGEIYSNSDEQLDININNISNKQFYNYIDSCKENGFVEDSIKEEYSYTAFTDDGYQLKLDYSDYSKTLDIELNIPEKFEKFEWSKKELAKLLPIPESNVGKIEEDSDKKYIVKVSKMDITDFNKYISLCEEKGFNIDENKQEKLFTAKNTESNKLEIEYLGNNIVKISLYEPEFDVKLKVDFVENWIFSKYDVTLYIDDSYEDSLSHGEDDGYNLKLSKGQHKIKFVNNDDDGVKGNITIDINKNETVKLKINCYSTDITIENLTEKNDTENQDSNTQESNSTSTSENNKQGSSIKENLTIENCPELASILSNNAEYDESYSSFATKYSGKIIEFDGRIDYITQHGNYKTRVDMLVSAGNYDANHQVGPTFKFEDKNAYDLGLSSLDKINEKLPVGSNVHIIAEVVKYNISSQIFFLDPVSVIKR